MSAFHTYLQEHLTAPVAVTPTDAPLRTFYQRMLDTPDTPETQLAAREWLEQKLQQTASMRCELPADPDDLYAWMDRNTEAVGERYQAYLARRASGAPREMLRTRSHALQFLAEVAPTKLVDGSWLFGSLKHHADPRFRPLITTYLEELGMGDEAQNHVNLFAALLRSTGAQGWEPQRDALYEQGAVQLALGLHGHELVPEMAGFNLGYEQLPYHLHVTAYELNELGIDPYYFTVHVTVDNAGSGHARQAVDAVLNLMPDDPQARADFYRRVGQGFMLNDIGISSTAIAENFDAGRSVVEVLQKKSRYGRAAHADYCRIGGRTVNAWLSNPADMPAFLACLEDGGWIVRHQDPQQSRFWQLLSGDGACMFGVFNAFELQLIYDWIAGDCPDYLPGPDLPGIPERPMVRGRHLSFRMAKARANRLKDRQKDLQQQGALDAALTLLSPGEHHTERGREATKAFAQAFAEAG